MARSHGKILASIWRSDEWRALTGGAQRLYMLLLSQPRLTLAGSLDVTASKWAALAADTALHDIDQALGELAHRRFVVVDEVTDELVIRTFTRYDLDPGRLNRNLAKGLWSAWESIVSAELRRVVVCEMPDAVWDKVGAFAPDDAEEIRRSARLEPDVQTTGSDEQSERPDRTTGSNPLSTPDSHLPPVNSRAAADEPVEPATTPQLRHKRFVAACRIIGERAASRPSTRNPGAVKRAVEQAALKDHKDQAMGAIYADPLIKPEALADMLEPPEPSYPEGFTPQMVTAAKTLGPLADPQCQSCDGTGFRWSGDESYVLRCDCTTQVV